MSLANLLYGPAQEASDELDLGKQVELPELRAALINALRRIHQLELQQQRLQRATAVQVSEGDAT